MDSKQKKCKQLVQSAGPTLNDLAKNSKGSCDPELNHVFTDSLLLSVSKLEEYMKIFKHSQRVKNGSVKGVVD